MNIFEDNQTDLENATEALSEYFEKDFSIEGVHHINEIRQNMINKAAYCEQRRKVLVAHVHEGHEKGWWTVQ